MIQLLAAEPTTPLTPKPCEHDAGGRAFTGRLKSLALYMLGEEDEAKLWAQTVQCLHCLNRLRALQQEGAVIGLPASAAVTGVGLPPLSVRTVAVLLSENQSTYTTLLSAQR